MTAEELKTLIGQGEADRIEVTRAAQDIEKFREAICAFSNDMAGQGLPGYLIIGIDEKNPTYRLEVTNGMLERLIGLRSDGEVRARGLVAKELKRLGWTETDLAERPKGNPAKVKIARRLRVETTMTLKWIAAELRMGTWTHVSNLLSQQGRQAAECRK